MQFIAIFVIVVLVSWGLGSISRGNEIDAKQRRDLEDFYRR